MSAITTSVDTQDLSIDGALQTLYFQNGFLYAISNGLLQVYSMGDSSMVKTSALPVVAGSLQTSLFTGDRIYLSDFNYTYTQDHSTLKVVDLKNPAFPTVVSNSYELPGGHSQILPNPFGILTVGMVHNFQGATNVVKLGLFGDPFATEKNYLLLGTDLDNKQLGDTKASYFDVVANRMFLPYWGTGRENQGVVSRIGVSHLEIDTIVSEGAVELPEPAGRVRPLPAAPGILSFADNSIELLTGAGSRWSSAPLLEHYTPIAVYRLTDDDRYLELMRLGTRCKLHLASQTEINQRTTTSEPFPCPTAETRAFGSELVFSDTSGIAFDPAGAVTPLTPDRIAAINAQIAARPICIFSREVESSTVVDYRNPPSLSGLECLSPEEFARLQSAAQSNATGTAPPSSG